MQKLPYFAHFTPCQSPVQRRLSTLWNLMNVFITFSTFKRLFFFHVLHLWLVRITVCQTRVR